MHNRTDEGCTKCPRRNGSVRIFDKEKRKVCINVLYAIFWELCILVY